jgi:hypothetical protein
MPLSTIDQSGLTSPLALSSPTVSGNLTLTSSNGGIVFNPSTHGTSYSSNTLADYEEGTWTPAWGGSSGSMGYAAQVGKYTKIGKFVIATCHVITNANNSFSGNVFLSGLPFQSDGTGNDYVAAPMHVEGVNLSTNAWIWAHVNPGNTTANIRYWINNAGAGSLQGGNLNAGSDIMVTCSYIAST